MATSTFVLLIGAGAGVGFVTGMGIEWLAQRRAAKREQWHRDA